MPLRGTSRPTLSTGGDPDASIGRPGRGEALRSTRRARTAIAGVARPAQQLDHLVACRSRPPVRPLRASVRSTCCRTGGLVSAALVAPLDDPRAWKV